MTDRREGVGGLVLDARAGKRERAFGAFVAPAAMGSVAWPQAGKGVFERIGRAEAKGGGLVEGRKRRFHAQPPLHRKEDRFLKGTEELGTAVGKRVGVEDADLDSREALADGENRRLGQQREIPAGQINRFVGRTIVGRGARFIESPAAGKRPGSAELRNRERTHETVGAGAQIGEESLNGGHLLGLPDEALTDVERMYRIAAIEGKAGQDRGIESARKKDDNTGAQRGKDGIEGR